MPYSRDEECHLCQYSRQCCWGWHFVDQCDRLERFYTSKGQTGADILADCLANAAKKYLTGQQIRGDWSDGDIDFEAGFYILKHTLCPAVLTENFFMDNHKDLQYLQSATGRRAIVDLHVEGIIEYIEK